MAKIKKLLPGTPQRIISKINEIIGAVNTNKGTADTILDAATIADAGKALGIDAEGEPALIDVVGAADAILDDATIADAGKALGIDAEGEPALISVSGGGGASILRCSLTYTGEGTTESPYIGHLDHATEILDALDRESSYDPIIVIDWDLAGQQNQLIPAIAEHRNETIQGAQFETEYLNAYGLAHSQNVTIVFMLGADNSGDVPMYMVNDSIALITTQNVTIADDVITFTDAQ